VVDLHVVADAPPAEPAFGRRFTWSTATRLLTSSFAILIAVGQLAAATWSSALRPAASCRSGSGPTPAANVLISTAGAALPLIAFRSLAGLGAGVNQVAERLYVAQAIDRTRLAFANGVLSAAGSTGSAVVGSRRSGPEPGWRALRLTGPAWDGAAVRRLDRRHHAQARP
jgi:hypothetical protein